MNVFGRRIQRKAWDRFQPTGEDSETSQGEKLDRVLDAFMVDVIQFVQCRSENGSYETLQIISQRFMPWT